MAARRQDGGSEGTHRLSNRKPRLDETEVKFKDQSPVTCVSLLLRTVFLISIHIPISPSEGIYLHHMKICEVVCSVAILEDPVCTLCQ